MKVKNKHYGHTEVQNKQNKRGTTGQKQKKKTGVFQSAEQTSRQRSKKPSHYETEAQDYRTNTNTVQRKQ